MSNNQNAQIAAAGLDILKSVTISATDLPTMNAAAAVTALMTSIADGSMVLRPAVKPKAEKKVKKGKGKTPAS